MMQRFVYNQGLMVVYFVWVHWQPASGKLESGNPLADVN